MSYLLNYRAWKKVNEATVVVNQLNGNMPDNGLVKISVEQGDAQGVHKLNPQAAADYERMKAAAKANGVVWGITDSYRPYEVQNKIFDWERFSRSGEKRKKGTNVAAAYPGTSNHGYGSAVDLNLFGPGVYGTAQKTEKAKAEYDKNYSWLRQNANQFGFFELKGEPWHWDHKASAEQLAKGGEAIVVPTQAISLAKLFVEKNPVLAEKLKRFEAGDLIIDENTQNVEDIITLFLLHLPEKYKEKIATNDLKIGNYGPSVTVALQEFQRDRKLPRQDGKFDVATYNEIFKNVIAKPSTAGAREITKLDGYVIASNGNSNEFALVYGGNPSEKWGAESMFKQVDSILAGNGKNVIYSNNENAISQVEQVLTNKYPDAKIVSISGFSGGGIKTLAALNSGKYKFIGLIDPFIKSPILELPQNTKIMFNPKNWGGENKSFQEVNLMMNSMVNSGSREVKDGYVEKPHSEMPAAFFTKYGKEV